MGYSLKDSRISSRDDPETILHCRLCSILEYKSIMDKKCEDLGKLAFDYHDRYGLPRKTVWNEILKTMGYSREYIDNFIMEHNL